MGSHLFSPSAFLARVVMRMVVCELRHDGLADGRLLPQHPPDRRRQGGCHGSSAGRRVATAIAHEGSERCDGQSLVRQEAAL